MAQRRIVSRPMQVKPSDIPHLIEAARELGPKGCGISERAYKYWIAGRLPQAMVKLLQNRALATALMRDAERLATLETERRAKK